MAYADYYDEHALKNGVLNIQRCNEPGIMIYMLPKIMEVLRLLPIMVGVQNMIHSSAFMVQVIFCNYSQVAS